jgi:hypothetical protein
MDAETDEAVRMIDGSMMDVSFDVEVTSTPEKVVNPRVRTPEKTKDQDQDVSFNVEVTSTPEKLVNPRTQANARLLKCDQCSFTSRYRFNLNRHVSTEHNKCANWCMVCNQVFGSGTLLEAHRQEKHASPHLCAHCGKTYNTRPGLTNHIKMLHDHEYRFSCATCKKGFTQKRAYDGHMNMHLNLLPYKCKVCKRSFNYESSYERHVKIVHPDGTTPDIKCDVCQQTFSSKASLADHTNGKQSCP